MCKIIIELKPLTYSNVRPALTVDEIDSIEDAYWITIRSLLRTTYPSVDYWLELEWAEDGVESSTLVESDLLTQDQIDAMLAHINKVIWEVEVRYLRWFSAIPKLRGSL